MLFWKAARCEREGCTPERIEYQVRFSLQLPGTMKLSIVQAYVIGRIEASLTRSDPGYMFATVCKLSLGFWRKGGRTNAQLFCSSQVFYGHLRCASPPDKFSNPCLVPR